MTREEAQAELGPDLEIIGDGPAGRSIDGGEWWTCMSLKEGLAFNTKTRDFETMPASELGSVKLKPPYL